MPLKNQKNNTTQGFTLVELSIVILIIGVLISGIAAGTSLIRQAELNSVIRDFQSFQVSYNSFVNRFGAPPGDFKAADSIWPNCTTHANGCNGNGNGAISNEADTVRMRESMLAWRHLYLAGMITAGIVDPVSIITNIDTVAPVPGVNLPASKYDNGGYLMLLGSNSLVGGAGNLWDNLEFFNPRGHINAVFLGKPLAMLDGMNTDGIMTPQEAFNIDQKVDDGTIRGSEFTGANSGRIRTYSGFDSLTADCIAQDLALGTDALYNVSSSLNACVIGMSLNE
jgi:prepilin-type N-terminal cleavage/methylation domain-containing protein